MKHSTKTILCAAMAALTLSAVPQMFGTSQNDNYALTAEAKIKNYSGGYKVKSCFCLPSTTGCIAGGMNYHNFYPGEMIALDKKGLTYVTVNGVRNAYDCTGKMNCLQKVY